MRMAGPTRGENLKVASYIGTFYAFRLYADGGRLLGPEGRAPAGTVRGARRALQNFSNLTYHLSLPYNNYGSKGREEARGGKALK